jgi:hypothetical protein
MLLNMVRWNQMKKMMLRVLMTLQYCCQWQETCSAAECSGDPAGTGDNLSRCYTAGCSGAERDDL